MKDSPSYQDFIEYLQNHLGGSNSIIQPYGEIIPPSTYTNETLTMLPPIETNESALIKMLWGTAALNDVILNKPPDGLKSFIHNTALSTWEVNIQKMEMPGGRDHKSIIIPATAIQKQHVDTTNQTITIPIKAFEGKSLIKLRSIPDAEGHPMIEYCYILLQSAKDPNMVQPVRLWKGERTKALKSMLIQKTEWNIQVQSGDSLLSYIQGQYKDNITQVSINIPMSLYNVVRRSAGIDISSITNPYNTPYA